MQFRTVSAEQIERVRQGRISDEERSSLFVMADLSGIDLSNCNLSRISFTGSLLFKTNFSGAELFESDFSRADATGADFSGANCSLALFHETGLGHAVVRQTQFFGADLSGATLTGARCEQTDFRTAKLCRSRIRDAFLIQCDCTGADFTDADFTGTDFSMSEFRQTNLQNALFESVHGYRSARWVGADIRQANFTGAYLVRREIVDQNYLDEFRRQDKLHELIYRFWAITSDCGRSIRRWSLVAASQILLFAGIYSLEGVDFGVYETPLSPLYFSVVVTTTLGFGDVIPKNMITQIAVILQVLTGYFVLGGLLVILTNKLARRAD